MPKSLRRLALEAEGWLDMQRPQQALERIQTLLDTPGARPAGLVLQVRALIELKQYDEALTAMQELSHFNHDPDWLDLTQAWCFKRLGQLDRSIACMENLCQRQHQSAIGHYNLACYLCLSGKLQQALDELTLACGLDSRFRALLADEQDLDDLRSSPEFQRLLP